MAKGSCAEVRSMLILAKQLGLVTEIEIIDSKELSIDISKNISNFIKYLESKIEKDK